MSLPANAVGGFIHWSLRTIFNKHRLPVQFTPGNTPLGPLWPLVHPKDKTPRTKQSDAVQCSEECTDLWSGGTLALTVQSPLPCTELTQTTPSNPAWALLRPWPFICETNCTLSALWSSSSDSVNYHQAEGSPIMGLLTLRWTSMDYHDLVEPEDSWTICVAGPSLTHLKHQMFSFYTFVSFIGDPV